MLTSRIKSILTKISLSNKAFSSAAATSKVDPFGGRNLKYPIPDPNRLLNKVAIVTGGSNGIGKATCELFANSGVKGLLIADLDQKNGMLLAEQLNEERKEKFAFYCNADMTKTASIENMVNQTMKHFGKLNIMFNNAGIMLHNDDNPVTTSEDCWDLTMNVNLKAVYLCCKFGIPYILQSGGGSVINTASFVAVMGAATPQLAYTASKGGVLAMTREMAAIYARQGIRFNSLCPGPLRTQMLMDYLNTPEKLNRRLVHIPMGRFGEAKEMAQAVAFLASDESSYVNGATFMVDGGVSQTYVTAE